MGAIKDSVTNSGGSALRKYQDIIVGTRSTRFLVRFELSQILAGNMPGALGLALRRVLIPGLFARCEKGVMLGRGVILRHPRRIELGRGVVVDDGCCLDAITDGVRGISIGSHTMIGMGSVIAAKLGTVTIGEDTGLGQHVIIHSSLGGSVKIGSRVLVAGGVYIGGGQYHTNRTDISIAEQGHVAGLKLVIEDNCWIGANATIVNGVRIGRDSIVAAGAVVTKDVPPFTVVAGVPAKVIRERTAAEETV